MKWLFILFSVFKPFLSAGGSHEMPNPIEDFKDLVKKNAVKVMIAFGIMSAMATIFAAGIIMVAVDVGAQYDQNAQVYFSAMITLGITLILLPVIIGAILVKKYDNSEEEEVKKRPVLEHVGTAHPLQDALALLIHDFVKEREMRRTMEETAPRTTPPTEERRHTVRETSPTADDFRH